jgi:hypothetical protein
MCSWPLMVGVPGCRKALLVIAWPVGCPGHDQSSIGDEGYRPDWVDVLDMKAASGDQRRQPG